MAGIWQVIIEAALDLFWLSTQYENRLCLVKTFKLEIREDKITVKTEGKSLSLSKTTDGVMMSPDFTEANRHLTFLPGGKNHGEWGDWGAHVTEPNGQGNNQSIADAVFWNDDLFSQAYMMSRDIGTQKRGVEYQGDDLAILNFEKMIEWADHWDLVLNPGDSDVIYLSELLAGCIDASHSEEEAFVDAVTFDLSVEELFEYGAFFAFNRTTGKVLIPHTDGYVNEFNIKSLFTEPRRKLESHSVFEECLELFDLLFEGTSDTSATE